jgi:hypothetical protein
MFSGAGEFKEVVPRTPITLKAIVTSTAIVLVPIVESLLLKESAEKSRRFI